MHATDSPTSPRARTALSDPALDETPSARNSLMLPALLALPLVGLAGWLAWAASLARLEKDPSWESVRWVSEIFTYGAPLSFLVFVLVNLLAFWRESRLWWRVVLLLHALALLSLALLAWVLWKPS